jgi:ankyrin repeat protein
MITKYQLYNESIRDKMIPKSEEEIRKSLEYLGRGDKFLKACSSGILWLVKELVEGGIDVNRAGSYALKLAITNNQYEIVEYLINNGSYVHDRFIDEAKDRKYHKIVDLLLDYKNNR